jgi:hypothetical protein
MVHSASTYAHGSEFNGFLFAPIGEDRNGMTLSVLSALARLDVDPWQEADRLARLPRAAAAQSLAALVAALPNGPRGCLDSGLIAKRLVGLLPRPASIGVPSGSVASKKPATLDSRAIIFMLLMAFMLGTQIMMAGWQASVLPDSAHMPAASATSGQMPSTTLDR